MNKVAPWGWNEPKFMGEGDDNSVFIVSYPGPDGTQSYLRVWVDPEDEYRVQSVRLRLPGRMTATEIRRFPWSDWLSFSDAFARGAWPRAFRTSRCPTRGTGQTSGGQQDCSATSRCATWTPWTTWSPR